MIVLVIPNIANVVGPTIHWYRLTIICFLPLESILASKAKVVDKMRKLIKRENSQNVKIANARNSDQNKNEEVAGSELDPTGTIHRYFNGWSIYTFYPLLEMVKQTFFRLSITMIGAGGGEANLKLCLLMSAIFIYSSIGCVERAREQLERTFSKHPTCLVCQEQ